MKRLNLGLILFFLMEGVILLFLGYLFNSQKESILRERLLIRDAEYHAMEQVYASEAETIYESVVNNPTVLSLVSQALSATETQRAPLRNKLHEHLLPVYNRLVGHGLKQLHFHMPDNHSFLRMHAPENFGDDLSEIRYSIAYTNQTRKPIQGFEEGRIYNGFRHLFPLSDPKSGNHIGSVEISFDSKIFLQKMREKYKGRYCFIVKKSIIEKKLWKDFKDNYETSIISPYYMREKACKLNYDPVLSALIGSIAGRYDHHFKRGDHFSAYFTDANNGYILSAIAIQNVKGTNAAAYILEIEKTDQIASLQNSLLLIALLLTLVNYFLSILLANFIRRFILLREMNHVLEAQVEKQTMALTDTNRNLEEKVIQQTKQLISQSRFAAMGEMAGMIAHHWRQPINVIAAKTAYIRMLDEENELGKEALNQELNEIDGILQELSATINTFSHFVKPDNQKITEQPKAILRKILTLIEPLLEENHIALETTCQCHQNISVFQHDMSQVLLAIIGNSIENFIRRKIENPRISIYGQSHEQNFRLEICDNAGGVAEEIREKIFEPYYSTKEERNYKGLGLYTAKETIEKHMAGTIEAYNKNDGLCIRIEIPLSD